MPDPWTTVSRREIFHARVFRLDEVRTRAPHTGDEHDFYVLDAADWVNVVPVTDDGRLVCVRQFRHGTERVTLEIPGGIIDAGETPEAAALRELREETGYDADRIIYLGAVDSNPAILTNRTHTCVALGLRSAGALALDATEDIEVELVPLGDLPGLVASGAFTHSLAVAALYLYDAWVRRGEEDVA